MRRYLPTILIIILFATPAFSAWVTGMTTWTTGQTLTAATLNSNFLKLQNAINGGLDASNFVTGFSIPATWITVIPTHGITHIHGGADALPWNNTWYFREVVSSDTVTRDITADNATFAYLLSGPATFTKLYGTEGHFASIAIDLATGTAISSLTNRINEVASSAAGAFFTGMIMAYSGAVASIPTGWHLCDGASGTPDLTGRFIMGADSLGTYNPGDTGGSNLLPWPTIASNTASHTHGVSGSTGYGSVPYIEVGNGGVVTQTVSTTHVHSLNVTASETLDAHVHALHDASGTVTTAFDNRPRYMTLCYIMKL